MNSNVEITSLNLEEITSGGNESLSNESVTGNNTTPVSVPMRTDDEKNSFRDRNIDCKTRTKRHSEKENEMSIGDQAQREKKIGCPEGFPSLKISRQSFSEKQPEGEKEYERKRHLPGESGNGSFAAMETGRSPVKSETFEKRSSKFSPSFKFYSGIQKETQLLNTSNAIEELRKRNHDLLEALMKTQRTHITEKKRFNDILLGLDKALSSLPIRLEKIRVRNQRNLSIIASSRFYSGDGNENPTEESGRESYPSDDDVMGSSQDSEFYVSTRMKCLLQKMDQLNDLIHTINEGDSSSPIELLVNSELYAINLLKKEIKTTKKQIEDNKSDTETVTSLEVNQTQKELTEDSSSKAKNSFSNELNKASNFKIFENHMMLQEEALNLLTRKIKETEEALLKEVEAKESLQRENEAMAKEIFRLKSSEEESKGESFLKTEKLKPKAEATNNRPYRLIKELKTKLEEKEKSLIAWKSKYSRSEAASANKTHLLETERKKNFELDTLITNMKTQNKSITAHTTSLQFINQQLRDQIEILKHQVEILANKKLDPSTSRLPGEQNEFGGSEKLEKGKKTDKDVEMKLKEMTESYENELNEVEFQVRKLQERNEMYSETFKKLLMNICNYGIGRDIKSIRSPSYNRIREILHITSSDLELLFSVYAKSSAEKEVERLCKELQTIVDNEETDFSERLSKWLFCVINEKLMQWGSGEKQNELTEQ